MKKPKLDKMAIECLLAAQNDLKNNDIKNAVKTIRNTARPMVPNWPIIVDKCINYMYYCGIEIPEDYWTWRIRKENNVD